MSTFHCTRCGRAIFRSSSVLERVNLWDLREYQAECYAVSEVIDLDGLTRYDASLHEGWYCCRFIVMRMVVDKFGTGDRLLVYADSVVEVADGRQAPLLTPVAAQLALTERDYDAVTLAPDDALKVVKFGAIWCPPCRLVDKVIERIASRGGLPGVQFFEVDIDHEHALAGRFDVQSIPFLVFYRGGRQVPVLGLSGRTARGAVVGGLTERQLLEVVAEASAGGPPIGARLEGLAG